MEEGPLLDSSVPDCLLRVFHATNLLNALLSCLTRSPVGLLGLRTLTAFKHEGLVAPGALRRGSKRASECRNSKLDFSKRIGASLSFNLTIFESLF